VKRILLVDDEPELLELLREHFEGRYEIEMAVSGASAIECFVRQRPDVVFLDINMPGGQRARGIEAPAPDRPTIPVIMATANTENAIAPECITLGAFGYVPKRFNLTYMDHMAAVATEQAGRPAR
jgi:CheY-like chemotaxis protein